ITSYAEKMYYGSHSAAGTPAADVVLSLNQQSMTGLMAPTYSVRVDFQPDTAVTSGSIWTVGVDGEANQAMAIVVKHNSLTDMCLFAIGYNGDLMFSNVSNVTQVEGGSFSIAGAMQMVNPGDLPGICEIFEGIISCCP
ncbi:MAG: hypothetical protein JRJ19_14585, partial [Deltaproteobacteria bacterium]|nr:hypothetical protein [Deltaproteobacteria bacterium]